MATGCLQQIAVCRLIGVISSSNGSGWQDLEESRITELIASFKGGQYGGMGVLTIPSVRLNQNKTPMLSAIDGQILLNNGKSTVALLKHMMEELANAEEEVEWSEGELARVFK
jgi:hypothetical protein